MLLSSSMLFTVLRGAAAVAAAVALSAACADEPARYPRQQPPPQQGPQYGPGPQQGGPYAGPPQQGAPPPNAGPGQPHQTAPAAPVPDDAINRVDIGALRNRTQALLAELVSALPPAKQSRVSGIPLAFEPSLAEVNAYATCDQSGRAAMALTGGLLDISAHLAQAKATDEVFGTQKLPEYIRLVASNQQAKQPVTRPAAGFFTPAQRNDGRKVARQQQVFDEQIAFVLAHELAHHYLGHLPCTGGGLGAAVADLLHLGSLAVPAFTQPMEYGSDFGATYNVLDAGRRRQGYRFTEAGGLLTMQFFGALQSMSAADWLFAFELSHPPPSLRTPWIQQAANAWRAGLPLPTL